MAERRERKRPVPPEVKPKGHRQYEATAEMRKVVEAMAGFGMPKTEIAKALTPPIQRSTLEKHYKEELETGEAKVKLRIATMCMVQLEGRPVEIDKEGKVTASVAPNSTMAIFMAKAKLGLRDVQVIEQKTDQTFDYSKLSKDELLQLRSILTRAIAVSDPNGSAVGSEHGATETKH